MGLDTPQRDALWSLSDSLTELAQLASVAGAQVVGTLHQRLSHPAPAHYVGKGKLQEVAREVGDKRASMVLFDDELSPTQQRNLENALQVKVIDRTVLVLDIFARRARTREGRLQVELAQHEYLLPRLAGQWSHLERLGGGIGTRGPGETQLETDRRAVRNRIVHLRRQLEDVRRHRSLYRRRRAAEGLPAVALVGYTNSGKSTLLNRLTGAEVLVEGKLFATLDPTTRRLALPGGREILLSDTVGFIQRLPTSLVAAFRATLEELSDAQLLLHVVDASHAHWAEQVASVEQELAQLELADTPVVTALNKMDLLVDSPEAMVNFRPRVSGEAPKGAVPISAEKGWGLGALLQAVDEALARSMISIVVEIPYQAAQLAALFRRQGSVSSEDHTERAIRMRGRVPLHLEPRFHEYRVRP